MLAAWQALAAELKPLAPMLNPELRALMEAMDAAAAEASEA
jgi:hypothetical protein